jgi:hypothetical protein
VAEPRERVVSYTARPVFDDGRLVRIEPEGRCRVSWPEHAWEAVLYDVLAGVRAERCERCGKERLLFGAINGATP